MYFYLELLFSLTYWHIEEHNINSELSHHFIQLIRIYWYWTYSYFNHPLCWCGSLDGLFLILKKKIAQKYIKSCGDVHWQHDKFIFVLDNLIFFQRLWNHDFIKHFLIMLNSSCHLPEHWPHGGFCAAELRFSSPEICSLLVHLHSHDSGVGSPRSVPLPQRCLIKNIAFWSWNAFF